MSRDPEDLGRQEPGTVKRQNPEALGQQDPNPLGRQEPEPMKRQDPETLGRREPETLCRRDLEFLRRRFAGHTPGLLGAVHEYAVLCPLAETPEGLSLLYEVRASGIRQGGEACFPGGRMEPGESAEECALREAEEELSIPRTAVELIGTPDFLCSQGGVLLRPVLGWVAPSAMENLRPNPAEVAEVFTVPLSFLRQTPPEVYAYTLRPEPPEDFPYEAVGVSRSYPWAAGRVEVPVWYWKGRAVWGMTARITRSLL